MFLGKDVEKIILSDFHAILPIPTTPSHCDQHLISYHPQHILTVIIGFK